jgi:hypothetical protein
MFKNIDWKGLLKAMLKAALPFLLGGAIGVTASSCSSLQTRELKLKPPRSTPSGYLPSS